MTLDELLEKAELMASNNKSIKHKSWKDKLIEEEDEDEQSCLICSL